MNEYMPHLIRARRSARRKFNELRAMPQWRNYHLSHLAAMALEHAEQVVLKGRYGTFGVEGFEVNGESVQHLNTGESYSLTVCYWRGRFVLSYWAWFVERFDKSASQ